MPLMYPPGDAVLKHLHAMPAVDWWTCSSSELLRMFTSYVDYFNAKTFHFYFLEEVNHDFISNVSKDI